MVEEMIIDGSVLDGVGRVLFVHAHPDDETIATGALIAALAERGVAVAVLTATRGERGEVVPGSLPAGLDQQRLSAARENELAAALTELGAITHAFLGTPPARADAQPRSYHDSGMSWLREGLAGPAPDGGPLALTAADTAEVVADIGAMITTFAPDLLISYDAGGGYGHPDHVLLHHATIAAGRRAGVPVAEIVPAEAPDAESFAAPAQREALVRALSRHASQLTVDGTDIVHVGGQREPIRTTTLLRVIDRKRS
ncbi:PIG-L family deacetylase [Naumannella huperziae]